MPSKVRGGKKLNKFIQDGKRAARRSKTTDVGFFASARYPNVKTGQGGGAKQTPHTVATVAAWNEFGNKRVPERPFFRNAIHEMKEEIPKILKSRLDAKDPVVTEQTAALLGAYATGEIQKSITDLKQPPNADSTIKRKGSENPLMDTGFMRQSVTWREE